MRAVFFGTPPIAVPSLQALHATGAVAAVVCQPDRPAGRGLRLQAPAVKLAALQLGLPVHQPKAVKGVELAAWLRAQQVDIAIVIAYGRILPGAVLDAPRLGALNLHASLLPKYRGAAPINWAIIHGELQTGISLMQMDEGMDTGPVFTRRVVPIGPQENAGELSERLAALAAQVTREDVPRVVAGELRAIPQDHATATYAPLLDRQVGEIHWRQPAEAIVNLVRGMAPRPAAYTRVNGKLLKVLEARTDGSVTLPPGEVLAHAPNTILVGAGAGSVQIKRAQLEGKRAADAKDLINGRVIRTSDLLGN